MKILLLDNYDSFTYNLYDYLSQTGVECTVLRNDTLPLAAFERLDFEAIVFSPGPKRPADAGLMLPLIQCYHDRVPMLGICLGHQAIGEFFGAKLIKAKVPMHGKTTEIRHGGHPLFKDIPSPFTAMRYHSLLLESLDGTPLECIAATADGEIMALAHRTLPLTGVQFHPESILTEYGLQMLQNWVELIRPITV
ncbi:MAG: aminodeoxychorismate/anthranilate synthase component II [Haliscomenobacteraceae bacterium CHB4]|nr:aminodeoxychorismate/anthranilate synthase component II [Haliscomenobacteraceae bacterium CHB4]